jgi:hypothetical protein
MLSEDVRASLFILGSIVHAEARFD